MFWIFLFITFLLIISILVFVTASKKTGNKQLKLIGIFCILSIAVSWNVLVIFRLQISTHLIIVSLIAFFTLFLNTNQKKSILLKKLIFVLGLAFIGSMYFLHTKSLSIKNNFSELSNSLSNYLIAYEKLLWIMATTIVLVFYGRITVAYFNRVSNSIKTKKIIKIFKKAVKHNSKNNLETAYKLFNKVVGLSNKHPRAETKIYRAKAYLGLGHICLLINNKDATSYFESAKRLNQYDDVSLHVLACAYFNQKKYEKVIRLFNGINTQYIDNKILLSRSYLRTKKPFMAVEILGHELGKWKKNKNLLYYLGCAYAHTGQYKQALEIFYSGVGCFPDDYRFNVQRGHVYSRQNEHLQAEKEYETAYQKGERNEDFISSYIIALLKLDKTERAFELINSCKITTNKNLLLGYYYEKKKMYKEAIDSINKINNIHGLSINKHEKTGLLYLKSKNYIKAIELLEKQHTINNMPNYVLYNIGWAYYKLNKFDQCYKYWSQLIKQSDNNRIVIISLIQINLLMAKWFFSQHNYKKCDELIHEYKDYYPDKKLNTFHSEIKFRLAYNSTVKNDLDYAIELLNDAHDFTPDDNRFPYYKALVQIKNGNVDKANAILAQMEEQTVLVKFLIAKCDIYKNRFKEAENKINDILFSNNKEYNDVFILTFCALKAINNEWEEIADLLSEH